MAATRFINSGDNGSLLALKRPSATLRAEDENARGWHVKMSVILWLLCSLQFKCDMGEQAPATADAADASSRLPASNHALEKQMKISFINSIERRGLREARDGMKLCLLISMASNGKSQRKHRASARRGKNLLVVIMSTEHSPAAGKASIAYGDGRGCAYFDIIIILN